MAVALPKLQKTASIRGCDRSSFPGKMIIGGNSVVSAELQAKSAETRTVEPLGHLKSSAEKMMHDHAAAKTDLQILRAKIEKSELKVQALELRLQEASDERSILKAKHGEDVKSWEVLVWKHAAAKSMFDKITDTLQQLETQLQQGEQDKAAVQDRSVVRLTAYEQSKVQIAALQFKLNGATSALTQSEEDVCKLKQEVAKLEECIALERSTAWNLLQQKEEGEKKLDLAEETLQTNKCLLKSTQHQLACIQGHLAEKMNECTKLQADYQLLAQKTSEGSRLQHQDLLNQLSSAVQFADNIRQERGQLAAKVLNLERTLGLATTTLEDIQGLCGEISLQARQENQAKKRAFHDLHELSMQYRQLEDMNCRLQQQWSASKEKNLEKLEVEISKIIIPDKTQKETDLDSSVREKGQLIQNMCHLKLENVEAIEEQSNSQLEEKAQDVDKLTRKNAVLLLVLKSCLEREKNTQTVCSEKSHLLEVTLQKLNCTEERLKQEVEKLTGVENSLLERTQQTELELEAKEAELNRHLKEIAARNDKEMSDFRMKLEAETREAMMEGVLQVRNLLAAHDMEKKSMIAQNREELTKYVLDFSKEKTKVGKLQEETELICQNFEFASVQERDLHIKLTKCEETVRGMGLECLRIQEEHGNEIARLCHSFHEILEEGKRGTLIWELKCKAMAKEIQQLRDKLQEEKQRYEAERETWEGTFHKSVARMEGISSREFDDVQVVRSQADTIRQEEILSEAQFQGLGLFGNTKLTRQVPNVETDRRSIDVLSERVSSKCDKVTFYEHGVSSSRGRKRIKKRKRNLEPTSIFFGAELEGLCGGGALDPYEDF